jgi:hypothetical protein
MLEVAADPKHLGAEIGFLSILHTWGQNLLLIHIFTAWFPLADSHRITSTGFTLSMLSSSLSKFLVGSAGASSSEDFAALSD